MIPSAGHTLGHYRLQTRIGRGGMGQVFRARDTRLQRDVAIKILYHASSDDERARQRLLREARAAAALSHPGIVTVHAVEEVSDVLFIVMELVDGVTLSDRMASGPLSPSTTCDIGAQVADALAVAHAAGIVHHDITPRNILLTVESRAKLVDFGLARAIAPDTPDVITSGRRIAGTPHYMSPEQARGDLLTHRSDLFSLGSVLYHAATGQRPFEGPSLHAIMDAIARHEPARPSSLRPDLPEDFDAIIGRLLAKPIEGRWVDANQVADLLRRLQANLVPDASASGPRAARRPPFEDSFVGRDRELAKLSGALLRAVAGAGSLVVVTGEAGMGKTALVDEFLRLPDTVSTYALVCRGQAVEHRGPGEAYLPILDALAHAMLHPDVGLHESLRIHAPSWRGQFPGAFPQEGAPPTPPTQERLARELGDAFCAAAAARPIVLVIEDLHWADPSTVDLLRNLAHRTRQARLLIIATCRAEEAASSVSRLDEALLDLEARRVCDIIVLQGLDEPQIREYLAWRFGLDEVSSQLPALLAKATDGQPLFIVSLVQLFIERGDLREDGGRWQLATPVAQLQPDVPRTVQAVIKKKLAALSDHDHHLLQHASVEGQEFSTAVLATLVVPSDAADLEESFDRMVSAGRFVTAIGPKRYPDGSWGARFRFAHAMYQNVVYGELGGGRRAALHRQVADRLVALHAGETAPIAAQLARHFKEGRDASRAFEHYMQAGDNAMAVSAGLEAEAHYSQALALATGEGSDVAGARVATAYFQRAIARVFVGQPEAAIIDFGRQLAGASEIGDAEMAFDAQLGLAYALELAERPHDAASAAAELKRSLEQSPDSSKRLRQLNLESQLLMGRGEMDRAAVVGDDAIALARSLDDRPKLLHALTVRAQLDFYRAEYASALPVLRETSGRATGVHRRADPRPLNVGFHGTLFLGLTLGNLGRFSEALSTLGAGLDTARRDGYGFWVPRFLNGLGWLHGELGDLEAAVRFNEEAVAQSARDVEVRSHSRLNLAVDYLRLGALTRAASILTDVEHLTKQDSRLAWRSRMRHSCIAADCWLAQGYPARATEHAHRAAALARRHGAWKYAVLSAKALADANVARGEWAEARVQLQTAVDLLSNHPIPLIAWRVHAALGRLHEVADKHGQAAAIEKAGFEVRRLAENITDVALRTLFLQIPAVRAVLDDEATISDDS